MVAVASGTATYLTALPPPPPLKIARNLEVSDDSMQDLQRRIMEISEENRGKLEVARTRRLKSEFSICSIDETTIETGTACGHLSQGLESASSRSLDNNATSAPISIQASRRTTSGGDLVQGSFGSHSSSPATGVSPMVPRQRIPRRLGGEESDTSDSEDDARTHTPATTAMALQPSATQNNPIPMVVQVDDDADADMVAVLDPPTVSENFYMCNTHAMPMQEDLYTPMARLNRILLVEDISLAQYSGERQPSRDGMKNMRIHNTPSFQAQMVTIVREGTVSTHFLIQ
jgi:hypothetical protein